MKFKKIINKSALGIGTIVLILAGGAGFSAFEAHIVNVTATVQNALSVPIEKQGLSFGTVFPEEVLNQNFDVNLSDSFLRESGVDDVSYMIRQKPKCVSDADPNVHPQVLDVAGNFACPQGSTMMPLLCPYLSKHETTTDGTAPDGENDGAGIEAFHGLPGPWTLATTISTEVLGHLQKSQQDVTDNWNIDLHVPPFRGMVAQDDTANPVYYLDPADESKVFGCDLWVEVTDISLPPTLGHLTVVKHVINDNEGTAVAANFDMHVSNGNPGSFPGDESGTLVMVTPGPYSVTEDAVAGYTQTLPDPNCSGTIAAGQDVTCVITNDDNAPTTGTLTVNKVVSGSNANPNSFPLFVDGSPVTNGVGTTQTFGDHVVSETTNPDYTAVISGDCLANGHVTVTIAGQTCTITNTRNTGTLTVTKVVDNSGGVGTKSVSDFPLFVDGNSVSSGVSTGQTSGSHLVSETSDPNYTAVFSGDCDAGGNVTVPTNGSAACTITNTAKFGTITVTKVVINNDGGNANIPDFSLFAGTTGVTSAVSKNLAPGTYHISETGVSGYAATFTGDCAASGHNITIAAGNSKSCTITNNDIAPVITLIKNVVGGTAQPQDFTMTVDGDQVSNNTSVQVTANANHVIDENAFPGYHFTSINGANCPGTVPGIVNLLPGTSITCTITNTVNAQ